jgi:hypothetical protein
MVQNHSLDPRETRLLDTMIYRNGIPGGAGMQAVTELAVITHCTVHVPASGLKLEIEIFKRRLLNHDVASGDGPETFNQGIPGDHRSYQLDLHPRR